MKKGITNLVDMQISKRYTEKNNHSNIRLHVCSTDIIHTDTVQHVHPTIVIPRITQIFPFNLSFPPLSSLLQSPTPAGILWDLSNQAC